MNVEINCNTIDFTEVLETLDKIPGVEITSSPLNQLTNNIYRLDTAIIVAIVSSSSAALGALIAGLLNILKQSRGRKIEIETNNGRIVVDENCPPGKVKEYIEMLKDTEIIEIDI